MTVCCGKEINVINLARRLPKYKEINKYEETNFTERNHTFPCFRKKSEVCFSQKPALPPEMFSHGDIECKIRINFFKVSFTWELVFVNYFAVGSSNVWLRHVKVYLHFI